MKIFLHSFRRKIQPGGVRCSDRKCGSNAQCLRRVCPRGGEGPERWNMMEFSDKHSYSLCLGHRSELPNWPKSTCTCCTTIVSAVSSCFIMFHQHPCTDWYRFPSMSCRVFQLHQVLHRAVRRIPKRTLWSWSPRAPWRCGNNSWQMRAVLMWNLRCAALRSGSTGEFMVILPIKNGDFP